jgi:hypothetical protein
MPLKVVVVLFLAMGLIHINYTFPGVDIMAMLPDLVDVCFFMALVGDTIRRGQESAGNWVVYFARKMDQSSLSELYTAGYQTGLDLASHVLDLQARLVEVAGLPLSLTCVVILYVLIGTLIHTILLVIGCIIEILCSKVLGVLRTTWNLVCRVLGGRQEPHGEE